MADILFLAHRVPFPPNRGDKIRSASLLAKLAEIAPVHVGCFAENDEDRAGHAILETLAASHCITDRTKPLVLAGAEAMLSGKPVSLTAFDSPQLAGWVRDTVASHDIGTIVIFSGQMGQYVPEDFGGRVVIDLCDVDSAKFENYAVAGKRVWLNTREGRLLAYEEERLARRANATILISENEAKLFNSRLECPSKANVQVIGNGIDAASFDPALVSPHRKLSDKTGPQLVFTGQMDYPPNEQAAMWAVNEFLPRLRKDISGAELHIVGRNPTKALLAHSDAPGLTIWGEVPDVKPFIAAATCVIAPLLIARGVQNKVLEAMAMARPVLLTPHAATGIAATDGEHWMVCKADAEAMTSKVNAVAQDREFATKLGDAARQFVLKHHAWGAMLAPLEKLIEADVMDARNAA